LRTTKRMESLPCPTCENHHDDEIGIFHILGNMLSRLETMKNNERDTKEDVIDSIRNSVYTLMRILLTSHCNVQLAMNIIQPPSDA
jgi:hypothetical protein